MNQVKPSLSFFGPARNIFSVFELGSGAQNFLKIMFEARLIKGF
jgi:hypothetical protein